ncbi:MAG: hypothetical protein ACK4SA_21825, partial [Caldilinea sp.]
IGRGQQSLWLFDPFDEERFRFIGDDDAFASSRIAFAPDGKYIAYSDGDGVITLWGVQSPDRPIK